MKLNKNNSMIEILMACLVLIYGKNMKKICVKIYVKYLKKFHDKNRFSQHAKKTEHKN